MTTTAQGLRPGAIETGRVHNRIIRLLLADDSADDTERVMHLLQQAGYTLKSQRVDDKPALAAALAAAPWDAILTEAVTPKLTARVVLEQVRAAGRDVPVIVVARRVSDDNLAGLMGAGARDVVTKTELVRLVPILGRELQVVQERRAYQQANAALGEMERRYRAMFEGARDAISYCHDGMHTEANPAYVALFGYTQVEELKGMPLLNLIDKRDHARVKQRLRDPSAGEPMLEVQGVKAGGGTFPVELMLSPITIGAESCVQVVATDVSGVKALEGKLRYLHQHDALTGLYNRHCFMEALGKAIEQARGGAPNVLVGIQLTGMQEVNQSLGHAGGDRLLLLASRQLREILGERAAIARVSGGQFAALIPAAPAGALEAIRQSLEQRLRAIALKEGDRSHGCHACVGFVRIDASSADRQALLAGLFREPEPARAPTAPMAPAAAPAAVRANAEPARAQRIRQAVDARQIEALYQPLMALQGEPGEHYEVIPHLPDADGGWIDARAIPEAAGTAGQANALDRWLVPHVVEVLSGLQADGRVITFLVPLSADAIGDDALVSAIAQHLRVTGLATDQLIFELDAAGCLRDRTAARAFLAKFRDMGARVAIEGVGRVDALNDLEGLPCDFFALEGTAISRLPAVQGVAKRLAKPLIVKGVDDMEIFSSLWGKGVDYVQGDCVQPAGPELNHDFGSDEHMIAADEPRSTWQRRR